MWSQSASKYVALKRSCPSSQSDRMPISWFVMTSRGSSTLVGTSTAGHAPFTLVGKFGFVADVSVKPSLQLA
jgi:hypothetical protein